MNLLSACCSESVITKHRTTFRGVYVFLLYVLCTVYSASSLNAQATGTGTITGRITDSSGNIVPGTTVTLKSGETLGALTAVTDQDGQYRVPSVLPATYEVRASKSGFEAALKKATVVIGGTLILDFQLVPGSVTETVEVTEEISTIDTERTSLSTNFNQTALTTLPISPSRRYQDVWALVPGVYVRPDQTDVAPSVNSRGTSENATKIDGVDVTDPYGGGVYSVSFNYEAIQDIQAKTIGGEAADGARTGGYMNIVTKSGGNTFHGSAAVFGVPASFNSTNTPAGTAPNQRKEIQPDVALGGPIKRDRLWFFVAYRRIQQDLTQNNTQVPIERRGNQWFVKLTSEFSSTQHLQGSFQWDRLTAHNAVFRSSGVGATSASSGLGGAAATLVAPSAFGNQVTGGPLISANYSWVIKPSMLFQFVAGWMLNKPQNNVGPGTPETSKIITTNAAGNIAGSLTTIAQEGGFGENNTSDRSMLYFSPSFSWYMDHAGHHEFKFGGDLYPFLRNKTATSVAPVEYYFRYNGTDTLYERDTFRTFDGNPTIRNEATERVIGGYVQDQWKITRNLTAKIGFRLDGNQIYTKDRHKVLSPLLPDGFPTKTDDEEFSQVTPAPTFGVIYNGGKFGVFRATASRFYEWLDLGGGDGTSHAPYVLATDTAIASPKTNAPTLNVTTTGSYPIGVNYGEGNKKTYDNEFSAGWEHTVTSNSTINVTFLIKRTWDFQGTDDMNITRDPTTGYLVDRPWPDYDSVLRTYAPNYSWQNFRSIQFLFTKNFGGRWGMNANYWYAIHQSVYERFNPTRDTVQFKGITTDDYRNDWVSPHHQARMSSFVRLPFGTMLSGVYSFTQGPRSDVLTGDFALGATRQVVLSNGRRVTDSLYNTTYPRAKKAGADMLAADDAHVFNIRGQKSFSFGEKKVEVSCDAFNMFNNGASFGFSSSDSRSASFGRKTNYIPARVVQIGGRFIF